MRHTQLMAALACGLLLGGAAHAGTVSYHCEGPGPHGADIAAAITEAGPGGTVQISGECFITSQIIVPVPVTLQGTGSCPSINAGASSCIALSGGASGSTVKNLTLNCQINGVTVWISGGLIHAPDDITVVNNEINAGLGGTGRPIQIFGCTGPPFNDVNACDGSPAGLPTGWLIANNVMTNPSGIGILNANGSQMVFKNNDVSSLDRAYATQNNTNSSVCAAFGGAPPGGRHNVVINNRFTKWAAGGSADNISEFGFDFFAATPEDSGCVGEGFDRGGENLYRHNCHLNEVAANGFRLQLTRDLTITQSNFVASDGGVNLGAFSFDSQGLQFVKNAATGFGDQFFSFFFPTDQNNVISQNKIGLGYEGVNLLLVDLSTGPNWFTDNKYCEGDFIAPAATVIEGNQDGHFCGEPPTSPGRPDSACSASTIRRGCSKEPQENLTALKAPAGLGSAAPGRDRQPSSHALPEPMQLEQFETGMVDLIADRKSVV